jgi:hypothetical protein
MELPAAAVEVKRHQGHEGYSNKNPGVLLLDFFIPE